MKKLIISGRFCVLMIFFSCRLLNVSGQDTTRTARHLTFDESIQIALTNSTTILKGMNTVELTGAQVLAAHGQFLPDAIAGTTYSYTGGTNLLTVTVPTLPPADGP